MKIFIACSKESVEIMDEIEMWLQDLECEVLRWDRPGLFPPGEQTFNTLINISKQIDGAICLFSEDDKVWYRGDTTKQPRDNILIEYGLFVGALGPRKTIICRYGAPKNASDLLGLTVIDINDKRKAFSKTEIKIWAKSLNTNPVDPAILSLQGRIHELEKELEISRQEMIFEREKANDLERMLERENIINFSEIDLQSDGHWKLLFNSKYFDEVSKILSVACRNPADLKEMLRAKEIHDVSEQIAWQPDEFNSQKTYIMSRKVLRVFRRYYDSDKYLFFYRNLPDIIQGQINAIAHYSLQSRLNTSQE